MGFRLRVRRRRLRLLMIMMQRSEEGGICGGCRVPR